MFCNYKDIPTHDNKNSPVQVNENYGEGDFSNIQRRALAARALAYDTILRDDYERKRGECRVRESISLREKNVRQWQRNLKDEIQKVSKQHRDTECCLRDVAKAIGYFNNVLRVSSMCSDYRKEIDDPNKTSDEAFRNEIRVTQLALDAMNDQMEKLKVSLGKLENVRNPLADDVNAKALNFLALVGCDNAKPLLFDRYDLTDPVIPTNSCNETQWAQNTNNLIQYSRSLRQESCQLCVDAENAIKDEKGKVSAAWVRASNALADDVYRDRYLVDRCQEHLSQIEKDISYCLLRIDTMHDEFDNEDREKKLEVWRLHKLNYRPPTENIQDRAFLSIANELEEIEKRMHSIAKHFKDDKELLADLHKVKDDLTRVMNSASQRLHANRENCQGIRRTVVIEGLKN